MYIKKISIHNSGTTPGNINGYRIHADAELVGTITYSASKSVYDFDDVKKFAIAVIVNGSTSTQHPIQLAEVKIYAAKEGYTSAHCFITISAIILTVEHNKPVC
jgi:hypothetical protein